MAVVIEDMKKVSLAVLLETGEALPPESDRPQLFDFIYGVGRHGATAFELSLSGKTIGDVIRLNVSASQAMSFFGPLFSSLQILLGMQIVPNEFTLSFEVTKIATPENREVVQALAKSGGCGGSCDCGC